MEDVDSETLEHKLASLFLSMQTVLHVSRSATQKIVEHLHNLLSFSNTQTFNSVKEILSKHKIEVNDCVLQEISSAIAQTNPLLLTISEKGSLSTDHRRNIYFKGHFLLSNPQNICTTQPIKTLLYIYLSLRYLRLYLGVQIFLTKLYLIKKLYLGTLSLFKTASITRRISYWENKTLVSVWDYTLMNLKCVIHWGPLENFIRLRQYIGWF